MLPTSLIPGASKLGVETYRQIKPQKVKLTPVNDTTFKPNANNMVTFKIPAFSNSFVDTSKSFLSFDIGYDTTTTITAITNSCRLTNGASVFQRLVLKTSNGLVIDSIDNMNVLEQIVTSTMPAGRMDKPLEGVDANSVENGVMDDTYCFANDLHDGLVGIRKYIDFGLLSRHTKNWVPVGSMDGSGYAFTLELQLADNATVIAQKGAVTSPVYYLKNVRYNMEVMTLSEELCKKFNEIACDGREMRIPFKTVHAHTSSLSAERNIVKIHETATSMDRVWNVLLKPTEQSTLVKNDAWKLYGGVGCGTADGVVSGYNAKVGSSWVFNEFVEEPSHNAVTVGHVKNAVGAGDEALVMEQVDTTSKIPLVNTNRYVQVFDFQYTQDGFLNGLSSSTPLEIFLNLASGYTGALMSYSFAEISYDLVVKDGMVSYEEPRPGSNSVY